MTFNNTSRLQGDELSNAVKIAADQDVAVLAMFQGGRHLTPSQAWKFGTSCGRNWLLTSVRRSFTNLTNEGKLIKTGQQRAGPYGRPEYIWTTKETT